LLALYAIGKAQEILENYIAIRDTKSRATSPAEIHR
jgi:hypothetical protein